jgi:hypothetical protein
MMALHTDTPPSEVEDVALDRTLGDEWFDWKGGVEECGGDLREGRRLFLSLSSVVVAAAILAVLLLWFLISPRLLLIGPWLHGTARTVIFGCVFVLLGWYVLTLLSVLSETRVLLPHAVRQHLINAVVPWAVRLGKGLGISRDRVSNSFVKVSNSVARATGRRVGSGDILLLLPRCLTANIRRTVMDLGASCGCKISTASGGTVARLQIDRLKPQAIITMACERDLVSGIQDVASEIPVIAIPNKRPKGPCKNTEVDLEKVRSAIELYLGPGSCSGAAQETSGG